jgi:hypothetical protein
VGKSAAFFTKVPARACTDLFTGLVHPARLTLDADLPKPRQFAERLTIFQTPDHIPEKTLRRGK